MPHATSQPDRTPRHTRMSIADKIDAASMYQRWHDHEFEPGDLLYSIDHAVRVKQQAEQAVKVDTETSSAEYPESLNPLAAAPMDHSHLEKLRDQLNSGDDIIDAINMVQNPIPEPQLRQKPSN